MEKHGIFDLRSWFPREKRRKSQREHLKGVTGCEAGKPRSCAEDAKRARRRKARAKGMDLARHLISSNPSGSKRLRQFEKYRTGLSSKNVTFKEAQAQYRSREEQLYLVGSRGERRLRLMKPTTAQHVAGAFA